MTQNKPTDTVCFIGSPGAFSLASLQTLLAQQINIAHIILAGRKPAPLPEKNLPVSPPAAQSDIATLATQHRISITYVDSRAALDTLPVDTMQRPAFILIAGFPYRLPHRLIHWPCRACLNLHPSLLPAYRGPDPLFWQLQRGETSLGVTLHHVSEQLDAGAIVSQCTLTLEDGASLQQLATRLAQHGTRLFIEILSLHDDLLDNAVPQNAAQASDFPMPTADDYQLHTSWRAQHAFNFLRGTCSPSGTYPLQLPQAILMISEAIDYDAEGQLTDNAPFICSPRGDEMLIQFSPGILRARGHVTTDTNRAAI